MPAGRATDTKLDLKTPSPPRHTHTVSPREAGIGSISPCLVAHSGHCPTSHPRPGLVPEQYPLWFLLQLRESPFSFPGAQAPFRVLHHC